MRADNQQWQIREVRLAIDEANAGDFASRKELHAFKRCWLRRTRPMHGTQAKLTATRHRGSSK